MDVKTTSTKAWIAGLVAASGFLIIPMIERFIQYDLPQDIENAIMAALLGAVTGRMTWQFPNKPITDKTEGGVSHEV